ncbi:serine hydrolase [Streptomyces sp. AP-93]|uniref:serine hydrolase domain-containing protein n=1 Tax=Streptomyces sp. AP-93 TaxID=2929048 RepID=UPI001FB041DA|nr:serine hydrolase domain-containing protein [Streptomyces sp. AP-93]MCJ0868607.1 beta-lactamase family protein [Streptomyces sp. AP-93]
MSRTPTFVVGSDHEARATHGHDATRYVQIGSLTKVVTGTVLVRLVHEGVLGLDDPVERWLPAVPGTGITLRNLADHTSGLPRLPPHVRGRDPYRSFDQPALVSVLRDLDRVVTAPAGQEEEYSNLGYAVLGAALCAAAGLSYEELVRDLVLDPLGVGEMTAYPPDEGRLLATSRWGRPVKPWTMSGAILPAGGLWATPTAAARLVAGLLVDRVLGEPAPSWQRTGGVTWHNGATRGASVFAGVLTDGRWVLVHRLGGSPTATDRMGGELLARRKR